MGLWKPFGDVAVSWWAAILQRLVGIDGVARRGWLGTFGLAIAVLTWRWKLINWMWEFMGSFVGYVLSLAVGVGDAKAAMIAGIPVSTWWATVNTFFPLNEGLGLLASYFAWRVGVIVAVAIWKVVVRITSLVAKLVGWKGA